MSPSSCSLSPHQDAATSINVLHSGRIGRIRLIQSLPNHHSLEAIEQAQEWEKGTIVSTAWSALLNNHEDKPNPASFLSVLRNCSQAVQSIPPPIRDFRESDAKTLCKYISNQLQTAPISDFSASTACAQLISFDQTRPPPNSKGFASIHLHVAGEVIEVSASCQERSRVQVKQIVSSLFETLSSLVASLQSEGKETISSLVKSASGSIGGSSRRSLLPPPVESSPNVQCNTSDIDKTIQRCSRAVAESVTVPFLLSENGATKHALVSFLTLHDSAEEEEITLVQFRKDEQAVAVIKSIRRALSHELFSEQLPFLSVVLPKLPCRSDGGVDILALRRLLLTLDLNEWRTRVSSVSHRDESSSSAPRADQTLLRLVAELCSMRMSEVDRNATFPSIGLNSIKAMMLSRRLVAAGFKVSAVDIARHENVASLAQFLAPDDWAAAEAENVLCESIASSINLDSESIDPDALLVDLPLYPVHWKIVRALLKQKKFTFSEEAVSSSKTIAELAARMNSLEDSSSRKAEHTLRTLIAELCGLQKREIDKTVPFPNLGLNSIKAMMLARRLGAQGYSVSPLDIAQHGTLASLASKLSSAQPSSQMEVKLREMISPLCGIEGRAIDRNAPFASYGLDSIKGMKLAHRLTAAGTPLSPLQVAEYSTLATLAEQLSKGTHATNSRQQRAAEYLQSITKAYKPKIARSFAIDESEIECVMPPTPLQLGMLAETLRDSAQGSYWLNRVFKVEGDVESDRLRAGVEQVLRKVDSCRLAFCETTQLDEAVSAGTELLTTPFVQFVRKSSSAVLKEIRITDSCDWQSELLSHGASSTGTTPVTGTTPLAFVFGNVGADTYVLLRAHHSIFDAQTLSLLERAIHDAVNKKPLTTRPFFSALPYILALDKKEEDDRSDCWRKVLEPVASQGHVTFPDIRWRRKLNQTASQFGRVARSASLKWSDISSAARSLGTSARPIAQCAWAVVLSAYMDTDWVVLGDSVSGRTVGPDLDDVTGPLLATVPIAVQIRRGKSHREIVTQCDKYHKSVMQHQHVPLGFIRQLLGIEKDQALFQSAFVFENIVKEGEATHLRFVADLGLSVEHPLALEVFVHDEENRVELGLVYREDLVLSAEATIMLEQMNEALAGFCTRSDSNIEELFEEESQMLSVSELRPSSDVERAIETSAETWLLTGAQQQPEAVAVEFWPSLEDGTRPQQLTYRELKDRALRLATHLAQNVQPRSIVAVCLSRCLNTYVSLFAIQLAGMVYLPIDESLPEERQRLLVDESQAAYILTESAFSPRFTSSVLSLDDLSVQETLDATPQLVDERTATSSDLSYVLFTSGSTGKPKGCKLTRGNLSSTIEAFRLTYEDFAPGSFAAGARFLARSAEAFDVALLETFLPIRVGATIVTGPRQLFLEDLGRAMAVTNVTHAAVVPSLFFSNNRRVTPASLPQLRALIVGGEQVAADIVELWGGSDVPTLNAYGPTEVTIGCSISLVQPESATSNIGKALYGSQYVVMKEQDGQLQPTLRGQAGELCVIGPQVGAGYLGQDSPAFCTWKGKPLYRTGDLARMSANDDVQYLGRIDSSQVKIRGARLELKEIDSVLKAVDESLHIVTILSQPDPEKSARLVSFIATQAHVPKSAGQMPAVDGDKSRSQIISCLHEKARSSLPPHMRPSSIVSLTFLPLASVSAKVDLQALKSLAATLQATGASEVEPSQQHSRALKDAETTFVEELAKVLDLSSDEKGRIGPESDLFATGLDSLSAITLVGRLKRRGLHTTMVKLLSTSSVAEAVEGCSSDAEQSSSPQTEAFKERIRELTARAREIELTSSECEAVLPCLPLQESLMAETISRGDQLYISRISIDLAPEVDTERLRVAVDDTVAANAIWRTSFVEMDGQFYQAIWPAHSERAKKLWVDSKSELDQVDLLSEVAQRPPVRFCIAQSPKQLVLVAHHSLYDGASLEVFQREVECRYNRQITPSGPTFTDVVSVVRACESNTAEAFWQSYLEELSLTPFPSLHALRLEPATYHREAVFDSTVTATALAKAAQSKGITSQALAIAAFSSLYLQFTGEADSLFGLVLGGRGIALEGSDLVQGPMVTTVPWRTRYMEDAQDVHAQAQAAHKSLLSLYEHQHVSLLQIRQWADVDQELFNTLFSFLPQATADASRPSIFLKTDSQMQTEYPLAVEMQPRSDDVVELRVVYDEHLVPPPQAALLLQQLDYELCHLTETTSTRETQSLFSASNSNPIWPESQDHFLDQFAVQVQRRASAIAIDYARDGLDEPHEHLTFAELDRMSSILAHEVLASNIGGDVVAVYMQRSLLFYVTILAVWKAGKTYLPLDPTLPQDRLKVMLGTAKASLVLTDVASEEAAHSLACEALVLALPTEAASARSSAPLPTTELSQGSYILFTSGSTGTPKGVPISHQGLAAALLSWKELLPHSDSSRMLQLASPSFDVSLIEICMPLAFGFTVVSAPKELLLNDPEEALQRLEVTMADLPASLAPTVHVENLPQLDWLMSGGDAIDERVLKEWGPHGLINAWGPTEATIGNTLGFVGRDSKRSLVGKAYPGSSIYVLKSETSAELALLGAAGEIAVGGPQITEGYIGRDDLAATAFVTVSDGTRVYRTGDRGRLLADGNLEVLGRISRGQVKLRGQRLELEEVSHAFRKQAGIQDADTLYVQHPTLPAKQLVTWIALKGAAQAEARPVLVRNDEVTARALSTFMTEVTSKLPVYMIPSHVLVAKGALPLTSNNKVDHAALEKAFKGCDLSQLRSTDNATDGNWNEKESQLRKVIADFCQMALEDVKRISSFYRLGVDSLSAIRLARSIREAGLGSVAVKDVLRWPSIAQLTAHLGEIESGATKRVRADAEEAVKQQVDVTTITLFSPEDRIVSLLPCTPLQEGMLAQTISSNGQLYYHHHALRLQGATSASVKAAWTSLVENNDILRTTFHRCKDHSSWAQAVHDFSSAQFVHRKDQAFAAFWQELIGKSLSTTEQTFAERPMATVTLHEDDARIQHLVLSIHHALYDGNTLPQLLDDFDSLLTGDKVEKRLNFSQLAPALLSSPGDAQHWMKSLQGYTEVALPTRHPSRQQEACAADLKLSLPIAEAQSLSRELDVSLRTVATFAYAKALCTLTNTRDIVFGQIVALRDSVEGAERALGPAFNTIPTRLRLSDGVTASKTLKQLQSSNDLGRPHRQASLRDIQRSLGLMSAPFDALLDYQIATGSDGTPRHHLQKAELPPSDPSIQYSVNVEFHQSDEVLSMSATADRQVFTEAELHEFLRTVEILFVHALKEPSELADSVPKGIAPLPKSLSEDKLIQPVNGEAEADFGELNATEELLKQVLLEIASSSVDPSSVGPHTPLPSLGLDSISAIHFAGKCRKQGLRVTVQDVVKGGTLRGIASRVAMKTNGDASTHARAPRMESLLLSRLAEPSVRGKLARSLQLSDEAIEEILPATPGQTFELAAWLDSGKRLGSHIFAWTVEDEAGPIMVKQRLQAAWSALRQMHSILRTSFAMSEDQLIQIVFAHGHDITGDAVDFNDTGKTPCLEAAKKAASSLMQSPQTFERAPVRLHAYTSAREAGKTVAVLSLHHVLYDAWSIELLGRDLQDLYRRGGQNADDCSSSANFSDLTRELVIADAQPGFQKDKTAFWQQELNGAEATLLDCPGHEEHQGSFAMVFEPRSVAIAKRWESLVSRMRGLPPLQYLFMASYALELTALTGNVSPVFGLFQTGRSIDFSGIESLAGPLLNAVPVRASAHPSRLRESRDGQAPPSLLVALAKDLEEGAEKRRPYEQSGIREINSLIGREDSQGPLFNTYLNVIWRTSAANATNASATAVPPTKGVSITPTKLGSPTELLPLTRPASTVPSTVDSLPYTSSIQIALNVDILLAEDGDHVGLGVLCDEGCMDQEGAKRLIQSIVQRVKDEVDALEKGGETGLDG